VDWTGSKTSIGTVAGSLPTGRFRGGALAGETMSVFGGRPSPATGLASVVVGTPVEANAHGSTLRFEKVFSEHAPYVFRVLPRLGVGSADVDDVAQEVFLAVHHGLAQFEGRSRVRTWIYGICLRVAGNYRRKAHRRREVRGLDIETPVDADQGVALDRAQSRTLLEAALDGLSDPKRQVFVLYEIEELSMAEVAQAADVPLFTAYARLYAARREMRQAIERMAKRGVRP